VLSNKDLWFKLIMIMEVHRSMEPLYLLFWIWNHYLYLIIKMLILWKNQLIFKHYKLQSSQKNGVNCTVFNLLRLKRDKYTIDNHNQ
jgi:hypothetical protein